MKHKLSSRRNGLSCRAESKSGTAFLAAAASIGGVGGITALTAPVLMVDLRTAALNLLRLSGFHDVRQGLQTVMHNIKALLAVAMSP